MERFNSASAAILALQADKVSAVILDEEPAKQYVKQNPGLSTFAIFDGKEEYAIALHKDNISLLKDIDKALESLNKTEVMTNYINNILQIKGEYL